MKMMESCAAFAPAVLNERAPGEAVSIEMQARDTASGASEALTLQPHLYAVEDAAEATHFAA